MSYSNGQYGQNGQNGQYGQNGQNGKSFLSSISDAFKSGVGAIQKYIPKTGLQQPNSYSQSVSSQPPPPYKSYQYPQSSRYNRMRARHLARQGGRKTKKRGGTVNPNVSLTNLASSAYPIEGINSAQPQAYVGGFNRTMQRSRQAMFAGYKKGSKSKSRKGDKDFYYKERR